VTLAQAESRGANVTLAQAESRGIR
jgi:hypothetical protein